MEDFNATLELNTILDSNLLDVIKYSYQIKKLTQHNTEQELTDNIFNIDDFLTNDDVNNRYYRIFENDDIMDIINEYLGYEFKYSFYFDSDNINIEIDHSNLGHDDINEKHRHRSIKSRIDTMTSSKVPFLTRR